MSMVKISLDIAFADDEETFADALERLAAAVPSAWVRVLEAHGPGGGWPSVEVLLDEGDLDRLAAFYNGDESEKFDPSELGEPEPFEAR